MVALLLPLVVVAGWATADAARIARGREMYAAACAACHGHDGAGNPDWESEVRPVSFADCGTTAEPTELWETIVRAGGPARGLSSVMPSFAEAYTDDEIGALVAYLRTFCPDADRYPPGDLNFRRLLKTTKAFPEVEVVLRASHRPHRTKRDTEMEVSYENRIGPRFQYELVLPFRPFRHGGGEVDIQHPGLGDVEIEAKHVLHFDLGRLSIVSAGIGARLPTGSEGAEFGGGTAVLTPFAALGKGWQHTFFQAKLGAALPVDPDKANRSLTYAVGLSRALGPARTAWTPAVELVGSWSPRTRTHDYAAWIETSKPLNALGHVIAAIGVQVPIQPRGQRFRLEAYLLWDFGDGPFWIGW